MSFRKKFYNFTQYNLNLKNKQKMMENNLQAVKAISQNEGAGAEGLGEQGTTGSFISLDSLNNS